MEPRRGACLWVSWSILSRRCLPEILCSLALAACWDANFLDSVWKCKSGFLTGELNQIHAIIINNWVPWERKKATPVQSKAWHHATWHHANMRPINAAAVREAFRKSTRTNVPKRLFCNSYWTFAWGLAFLPQNFSFFRILAPKYRSDTGPKQVKHWSSTVAT